MRDTGSGRARGARRRWRPTGGQVLAALLAVAALIFIAQNRDQASINFLWGEARLSLWLALALMFVLGLALGYLFARRRARRRAG